MHVLGLDIGGANLKFCDADGHSVSVPFPMWTDFEKLTGRLVDIVKNNFAAEKVQLVAVVMTAELADCFATKSQGVRDIIEAVGRAFPQLPIRFWMTSGEFANAEDAANLPELIAAANWHAAATWVGRAISQGSALLLDIGSTTTDVIPIVDGHLAAIGQNDVDRLRARELVYVAAGRTPICALLNEVTLPNQTIPVAAELFATSADALIVNGILPADDTSVLTADGRSRSLSNCKARLARMLCADITEVADEWLMTLAEQATEALLQRLIDAVNCVVNRLPQPPILVVAGSGMQLAEKITAGMRPNRFEGVMPINSMFRQDVSSCLPAFAVARLASDRCRDDLLPMTNLGLQQK